MTFDSSTSSTETLGRVRGELQRAYSAIRVLVPVSDKYQVIGEVREVRGDPVAETVERALGMRS